MKGGSRKVRSPSKFTISQVIRQPGMKLAPVVAPKQSPAQGTNSVRKIRFGKDAAALLPTLAAVYGDRE